MQRAQIKPEEMPGFDRYAKLPNVPYAITNKPQDVAEAIDVGNAFLEQDASGVKTPEQEAADEAAKQQRYAALVEKGRQSCASTEGRFRVLCHRDVNIGLGRAGVPTAMFLPD